MPEQLKKVANRPQQTERITPVADQSSVKPPPVTIFSAGFRLLTDPTILTGRLAEVVDLIRKQPG